MKKKWPKILEAGGIFLILISFIGYSFLLFSPPSTGQVAGKTSSADTEVSLFIGEYRFTLFGYTSPKALVTIEGMGIFDQTVADEKGYFQFKNRFSPLSPREACLSAKDQLGRLTSVVCLPPFPINYNVTIGPVIMPPTLSLDKNDYFVGDEVILSGQTIPESQINLSMFTKEKNNPFIAKLLNGYIVKKFYFIKPAYAFSFPPLTTQSDSAGNFSVSLPSSSAKNFRLFTTVDFEKKSSPQSLTLTLKVLPWWMIMIKFFAFLWLIIKSRLLEIIILGQIIILAIYFFRRYFHPYRLAKNRAIVVREHYEITRINTKENTNQHETRINTKDMVCDR